MIFRAGATLCFFYSKFVDAFKTCLTLLDVIFRFGDVWKLFELLPVWEVASNNLRRPVGVSFGAVPAIFSAILSKNLSSCTLASSWKKSIKIYFTYIRSSSHATFTFVRFLCLQSTSRVIPSQSNFFIAECKVMQHYVVQLYNIMKHYATLYNPRRYIAACSPPYRREQPFLRR